MCKLIIVTNRKLCEGDFLSQIRLLCRSGADRIVLREKDLEEWEYEELAKKVLSICQEYQVECILHHFVYTAVKLHAPGIHLSVQDAMKHRMIIKDIPLVGVSTHSLEQINIAQACYADYVFFGHVFFTNCKPDAEPRGLELLREICQHAYIPVYAIGGIAIDNVNMVLEAGAKGACVMSWGMNASEDEVRRIVEICHNKE